MSLTALGTGRRVSRIAGLYARDLVVRPRARGRDDVPAFATSVTAEWLTGVLCAGTGAHVSAWEYEPVSRGSTCRGRFRLEYDGDGGETLPPTVFVKATSSLRTRLQLGSTGAIRAETRFYRELQPGLDVLAPVGYHGASDRRTGRSILLLEDIARTRNVSFGDIRTLRVDRELAESMVDTLARLHGSLCGSPRFEDDLRWVISSAGLQSRLNDYVDFERRTKIGLDRAGDLVPPELRARRGDLHRHLMASFALDERVPLGLVHTDVHIGNWFVTPDRRMGLCDWAAVARGQGPRDLAYALMSGLTIEDRRSWESDLIRLYAERVAVSADDVREAYRRQTMHGLCFWLYTLGSGGLQPTTQAKESARLNVERMAQAVVDLETLAALQT
jgi:hypothetical protein